MQTTEAILISTSRRFNPGYEEPITITVQKGQQIMTFEANELWTFAQQIKLLQDELNPPGCCASSDKVIPYTKAWLKSEMKRLQYLERYEEAAAVRDLVKRV